MGWSPFRRLGLTHHDPSRSFKGYTLLTPLGGKDVLSHPPRPRSSRHCLWNSACSGWAAATMW